MQMISDEMHSPLGKKKKKKKKNNLKSGKF